MKRTALVLATVILTVTFFNSHSQAQTTDNPTTKGTKVNWVDLNGDGICDNVGTAKQGLNRSGKGYGKKDGTGEPAKPQDGTGFGKKGGNSTASGTHDGTGPKGTNGRRGNK